MANQVDLIEQPSGNQAKHESRNPIQRKLIERFHRQSIAMINRATPSSILDLGCGEGYTLDALVRGGITAELHGIDLSQRAVRLAWERLGPRATIVHGDVQTLASNGRQFELVLMLEVLEHLQEPRRMLGLLEDITSDWLLLSVPWEPYFRLLNFVRGKNFTRWGNDREHINHWGRRAFSNLISERFDVVAMPPAFPWIMVLARKRRPRGSST